MRRTAAVALLALFAVGLWACSAWVLGQDIVTFKLKSPGGGVLSITGLLPWLLAAAPFSAGCMRASAAIRAWHGEAPSRETVRHHEAALLLMPVALLLASVIGAPQVLS